MDHLHELAHQAKEAAGKLALYDTATKNRGLEAIAMALEARQGEILEANDRDMAQAEQSGMRPAMLDRLRLTPERIAGMAKGVREVMALPDPVGEIMDTVARPNGLHIRKVRVPLGVVGIIYEARPNVTVDAAVLCLKSGNAAFLRGGKEAFGTNLVLAGIMKDALTQAGLDSDCVTFLDDTSHATADAMMRLRGFIDVLIPRGGAGLIRRVLETATIPTIETGTGNCHVYVDKSADYAMAEAIVINAKTQRTGVCNAAETLLVQEDWAEEHLKSLLKALTDKNVELHGDEAAARYTEGMIPATEADWADEYLRLAMAVKVVPDVKAAVEHINRYGTKHTECIVTADKANADYFLRNVDAAVVDWNASTRFTDGFEFGFGAELGISTQKLHARGPLGLEEITSYKYLVLGTGQVRP